MRNVQRKWGSKRTNLGGAPAVGTRRAGMHQASEHEYQRSVMANGVPEPETVEEALEMPAEIESEIPPEEEDDQTVEMVADGEISVEPEAEILEEIADPEAAVNEEEEEAVVSDQLSVDWSSERIPVIDPPVSDPVPAETPLEYSSGDGSLKEIQEPLPGLGEKFGVPPLFNGIEDPSANVPAMPEEPEAIPEGENPSANVPAAPEEPEAIPEG